MTLSTKIDRRREAELSAGPLPRPYTRKAGRGRDEPCREGTRKLPQWGGRVFWERRAACIFPVETGGGVDRGIEFGQHDEDRDRAAGAAAGGFSAADREGLLQRRL